MDIPNDKALVFISCPTQLAQGVEVRSLIAEANHAPAIPSPHRGDELQQSVITQCPLILTELS
jgi:hypothetical protein